MSDPGPRVALVTGAAQGIGRALAGRLARDGMTVVVADSNLHGAATAAEELCRGRVGCASAVEVDVADEDSVTALFREIEERHGRLDVLVNNAAIFSALRMAPFDGIDVAEWDRVMGVNVRGPFLCVRGGARLLRRSRAGKVINISSGAVMLGRPRYLHYVTSKAALIGMTRSLATELGPDGICVNAVAPGSVETGVRRETVTAEQVRAITARQAIGRRQHPSDVEGVVSFLASADSDFMTGQTLVVDGGAVYR